MKNVLQTINMTIDSYKFFFIALHEVLREIELIFEFLMKKIQNTIK